MADALFSGTQQRVLGLLFGQPERSFGLSELIRLASSGSGAVQREVGRLRDSGIITVKSLGGRKQVQANRASPIFDELKGIVDKTTGVAAQLREALEADSGRVRFAVLYGSVAKGTDAASSDIDVLLVSDDLAHEQAFSLFRETEARLGRTINSKIYTSEEFIRRWRAGHPFLKKVLSGKHVVLAGSQDALAS